MSEQRVTVVTGSSRGLGRGIAEYFSRHGDLVAGCSRGEFVGSQLENYRHFQLDVTDEAKVREWARALKREFSRVDLVINNVGLVKLGMPVGAMSLGLFREFVDAILISTFLVCREFSKIMLLQKSGRIVNVTSIMSELHAPGTSGYASAKQAVIEFTKVLARELSESGVTCNVVSPSLVATESSQAFGPEWRQKMLEMQTIKLPVAPDDVCHAIEFFAAPQAWCFTGQVVHTCLVS